MFINDLKAVAKNTLLFKAAILKVLKYTREFFIKMIAMTTAMLTMSPCNVKWEPSLTVVTSLT